MPIDASGQDDVLVGRIRKDLSDASGHSISMFVAGGPAPEGRRAERDPDRGAAAPARDGVSRECVNQVAGEPAGIPVKILRDQPAYALSRSAMTIFCIFIMACMARSAFLRSGSLR